MKTSRPTTREVGSNGGATVYEDLQISAGRFNFPGVNDPTWRTYNHGIGGGIAFDVLGFAVNDYIEFDIQTKHAMKLNSILDTHIHFILPNTTNIGDKFQFQLDVVCAGIGEAYSVPSGSPYTAEHTIVANDNINHGYLDIADIPACNTTVSSIYTCRLTRIAASANEYGSEVYVKFIDCHFEMDTLGSLKEGSKV